MSDDEKPAGDLRAKAALALAKRALDDALLSDDERAKRRAEESALSKRNRTKRIAQIVIGALIVVGLIGLMLNYWYWALLLGLVGVAGFYVRHRWRARRAARKKPEPIAPREIAAPKKRVKIESPPAPIEVPEESIDDDLAELKARMKR